MFRSLVVPLDGTPPAAQALGYLPFVAAPDARVTLVGVATPPLEAPSPVAREQEVADQLDRARALLWTDLETHAASLRAQGYRTLTTVRTGDVTEEIVSCARAADAALILLATHGSGSLAHWMLDSVAQRLLRVAMHATLLVHAAPALAHGAPAIRGLIVPLDGWGVAESALPAANELAERLAVPLHLVRVVPYQGSSLDPGHAASDAEAVRRLAIAVGQARAAAERYIEATVEKLRTAGRDTAGDVLVGDPAATLSAFASERPDALVVIATHGAGGGDWWSFGSVAEKLVTTTPNPILIVRPIADKVSRMRHDPAIAARYPD